VASTPKLFRNGAVGFIDWLDASTIATDDERSGKSIPTVDNPPRSILHFQAEHSILAVLHRGRIAGDDPNLVGVATGVASVSYANDGCAAMIANKTCNGADLCFWHFLHVGG
jgi:hypothetical protein